MPYDNRKDVALSTDLSSTCIVQAHFLALSSRLEKSSNNLCTVSSFSRLTGTRQVIKHFSTHTLIEAQQDKTSTEKQTN